MKIALLGDIGFYGKYSLENNPDIKSYFKEVSNYLSKFDLVVGNLETPFVTNLKPKSIKSAFIGAEDVNVNLLKYLNVDVVNLANNHIFDYGIEGYQNTIKLLDKDNIPYFGVNEKVYTFYKENNKIAFQGFCAYNTSPSGVYNKTKDVGVNELNIPDVTAHLSDYNKKGYFNVLSMHSGQEHVNCPSYEDIKMARKLSKICPYVYYGHHPHVLQGIETVNNSIIAYSLGNFCFDDVYTSKSKQPLVTQTDNNKSSIILELEIENNKVISHHTTPIFNGDKELKIGSDKIIENLKQYTNILSVDPYVYTKKRNTRIREFINKRKELRNLKWYLKRLNYKSAIQIYKAKQNQAKQFNSVTRHLE
jgi:poly-gamma-glutamate synthesis protein (capsule biosynthesis protein)